MNAGYTIEGNAEMLLKSCISSMSEMYENTVCESNPGNKSFEGNGILNEYRKIRLLFPKSLTKWNT